MVVFKTSFYRNQNLLQSSERSLLIWLHALFLIVFLILNKIDAIAIVFGYFFETLVVGLFYAIKLLFTINSNSVFKDASIFNKFKTLSIYVLQYLSFIFIQMIFVFGFLSFCDLPIEKAFNIIDNLTYICTLKGMRWVFVSFFVYHLLELIFKFVLFKAYKNQSIEDLIRQSYHRIFVQQLTVLLVASFIIFFQHVLVIAIILVLVRTSLETYFINKDSIEKIRNSSY